MSVATRESTERIGAADSRCAIKVAYVMSRFPKLTETFILFESLAVGCGLRAPGWARNVITTLVGAAIAERLVLSPRTVETHVANLVAKTKVAGRRGLASLVKSGTAAD